MHPLTWLQNNYVSVVLAEPPNTVSKIPFHTNSYHMDAIIKSKSLSTQKPQ